MVNRFVEKNYGYVGTMIRLKTEQKIRFNKQKIKGKLYFAERQIRSFSKI